MSKFKPKYNWRDRREGRDRQMLVMMRGGRILAKTFGIAPFLTHLVRHGIISSIPAGPMREPDFAMFQPEGASGDAL